MGQGPTADVLADWVRDARCRTLDLVADLSDEQLRVPQLPILNPFVWEIGHVGWFQERWVLRHRGGLPPIRPDGDALYDSSAVPHGRRWSLPLPDRESTVRYLHAVRDRVIEKLRRPGDLTAEDRYYHLLALFHEDMHDEAFLYTRQTLGYPAPRWSVPPSRGAPSDAGPLAGDVEIPGGTFSLGAPRSFWFVFDNERWEHPVDIEPFHIARAPVTQREFARFVDDGGYRRRELWTEAGWKWRCEASAQHPIYFRRDGTRWMRRRFDRWVPLEPDRPVVHVNAHEAEAFCGWSGRRLPTEAEWEAAAAGTPCSGATALAGTKRRYPWGDEPVTPSRANLDAVAADTVDVAAHPEGDSAFGCRQMIGNVWEWTSTRFGPYPGFEPGPYGEYSAPWFGTHRVLRGGSWCTRSRLIHNMWRNFHTPERRDVWAGFRTCRARP